MTAFSAEQFGPAGQRAVGGDDGGGALFVASIDDLERGIGLVAVKADQSDVVDDRHRGAGVSLDTDGVGAILGSWGQAGFAGRQDRWRLSIPRKGASRLKT